MRHIFVLLSGNLLTVETRHNILIPFTLPSNRSSISLSFRGGLRPPRCTSSWSDDGREVYLWLRCALLVLWRPPAHRRLITHLSAQWTLECPAAPLLRYTHTPTHKSCMYKCAVTHSHD